MLQRSFDKELLAAKEAILSMGGHVERSIDEALLGLTERNPEHFISVYAIEQMINRMHVKIDEQCVRLLALQGPVASDLRLIVGILKINSDLERMGDQAVNIAHNAGRYLREPPLQPMVDLPRMAIQVKSMVREALEAFIKRDITLAHHVLSCDDYVDSQKDKLFTELVTGYMKVRPEAIDPALDLILIARNLERIADHATNIAEDAIFIVTGEDVRHGQRKIPPAGMPTMVLS